MWRAVLLIVWWWCATVADVDGEYGGMAVLVDRVNVRGVHTAASSHAYFDYMYVAGDVADVWCVRWASSCALNLSYYFSHRRGDHGHVAGRSRAAGAWFGMVGVRTTLHAEHSGARLNCTCSRGRFTQIIHVTFIVRAPYDRVLELKVDSQSIRYLQPVLRGSRDYYVDYTLARDERASLECSTHVAGLYSELDTHVGPIGTKIEVRPKSDELAEYACVARNTSNIVRSVKVSFLSDLSDYLYDPSPLAVNTSGSLLESYVHNGDRLIYYHFVGGEFLTLTCSTLAGVLLKHDYTLVFGDTVEKRGSSIVKHLKLDMCDHNRTLDCSLLSNTDNVIVRNIRILFWIKQITEYPKVIGPAVVTVSKGSDAVIKCCTVGNPEPIVSWKFVSTNSSKIKNIRGTGGELRVSRVDAAREGRYLCTATNVAGIAEHVTMLVVHDEQADIEDSSNIVEVVACAAGVVVITVCVVSAACWRCRRRAAAAAATAETIDMTESRIRRRSLPQVPYNPVTSYECVYPENVYCEIVDVQSHGTKEKQSGKPSITYDYAYGRNDKCKVLSIPNKKPTVTYDYHACKATSPTFGITPVAVSNNVNNSSDYADSGNRYSVCPVSSAGIFKDPLNAYDYADCSSASCNNAAVQTQAVCDNDPQKIAEGSGVQNTMYYWISSSSSSSSSSM